MNKKQKKRLDSLRKQLREKGLLFPQFQELCELGRLNDDANNDSRKL